MQACYAVAVICALIAGCTPTLNWREFRSPDGFIVLLPARSQTVVREVKLPDAAVQMSMTSTGVGATLFAVGAAQLPAELVADAPSRLRTIAFAREALVRNVNGRIVKSVEASLALPPNDPRKVLAGEALEAVGSDPKNHSTRLAARLFIVDDRLFQLVALGAEGEISSLALETFFASFRLP